MPDKKALPRGYFTNQPAAGLNSFLCGKTEKEETEIA